MTAPDAGLHRRAGARCAAAEPHRHPGEDWPCRRCIDAVTIQATIAAQLSAPAPASSGVAPQPRTDGASGGSGRVLGPPSGQAGAPTLQTDNRPGLLTPRAAYRPNDLGQNGR